MPARKTSILVADDDPYILRLVESIMEVEGYHVLTAADGETALKLFIEESPDAVLLDVRMPGMDGFAVCRRIREFSQTPIVMITAKDSDNEKVEGLDAGADDYVTKPFSSKELAARVRAVLRRSRQWEDRPDPVFRSGDLEVDFARHTVSLAGNALDLSATEYNLLSYLAGNAGRWVSPDQILSSVWGDEYVGEHHLLRVNVTRLRQKLHDDPREPKYIATKINVGYMFLKPPSHP